LQLSCEASKLIEDAATVTGQTVDEFAVSVLLQAANVILRERQDTRLSVNDRRLFAAMLDDTSTIPNCTLKSAVRRYNREVRRSD
jgi:uncharacterized protein (DUF1778 family)